VKDSLINTKVAAIEKPVTKVVNGTKKDSTPKH